MTARSDIVGPDGFSPDVKGRLIYTCNCGWVDLGHANSSGARKLLDDVRAASAKPGGDIVNYSQSARGIPVGGTYYVRGGLSAAEQNSVALGIFQRVTNDFESTQGLAFWSDSSFSQEDLVSNLIGFHAAAKGQSAESLIRSQCGKILSKEEAEAIWDQTGGVGANKNRRWEPVLHKCTACQQACPGERRFPSEFRSIPAAQPGQGFSLL